MANIMVNEACNLRCPYCFAEEFVNKDTMEMSIEDFNYALNFMLADGTDKQVGIIGGEPLLYSNIDKAMRNALSDSRSEHVMLFTNAVALDTLADDILEAKKFRMLVNCNSPEDMGEKAFEKMRQNLLDFQNKHFGAGRFRLSVNMYKPDFDYSYIIPLVQEIGFDVIRLSISVPQKGDLKGKDPLEYFAEMKKVAMSFVVDMIRCGVMTGFDCNFIPSCVMTDDEKEVMRNVKKVFYDSLEREYSSEFWFRCILCEIHNCTPVVDILPDLTAIRCFGLSEYTKQDIRDFEGIDKLRDFYIRSVDRPAHAISSSKKCEDCFDRELGACSGGCLLYKANQLFPQA